ncbi:hypothetical protein EUGRSUZ_I01653 [Eucalyptus grandis]|uniref:Uncharacterized protein n=2 Tax=Eucalyptus grandis TaxID=71139 RepID=A0ACC3JFT5_EUCGR|nr:hypothetical protein EUGRSUZ_I01653 [Eucalyptus grandis]
MASSLPGFLSFLLPSKPPLPPPPPPPVLSLSTSPSPAPSQAIRKSHRESALPAPPGQEPPTSELSSVMCPSLAYANTLFFRSAYNVQLIVADNEPEERLLNRFRREVMKAGVIQECKRRRFFENAQDEKKRKSREAAKRNRKRRPFSRAASQNKDETATSKKSNDEGDNWDLPEEDIPY